MCRFLSFSLVSFIVLLGQPAHAITIDYEDTLGKRWGDANDTVGFSWIDIEKVCPTDGVTPCTGLIGGTVDVTGWIWGTQDQVRELFREVTGLTTELDGYMAFDNNLTWAAEALKDLTRTYTDSFGRSYTAGWTSTTVIPGNPLPSFCAAGDCAWGAMIKSETATTPSSAALLTFDVGKGTINYVDGWGAWLFQPAGVPEPSTLLLLATGLAGVMRYARRQGR